MLDSSPLTWIDIAVAGIVIVSALLAFSRGFMHEVLSVTAWVGAIFAMIYSFPYLRPYAHDLISIELIADLAAGATIFIVSLIVFSLLTSSVTSRVKDSALNALDRSLGFLFGLIRGMALVCLAYILISWIWTPEERPVWLQDARSIPVIEAGANILRSLVPGHLQDAGSGAVSQARSEAELAMETKRMLDEMLLPQPKSPAAKDEPGYSNMQRDDMKRLIEGAGQ